MKRAVMLGTMLAALTMAVCAQTVQVYSEFVKLNDAGEVVAPTDPREILSPAIARNAFSSFQIAVQVPPTQVNKAAKFHLFMGQNPEGALKVTVYRRVGDKLEPVGLPYAAESSQVFWMDVWVDGNTPVRRVKLEPQVYIDGDWITYPMEVRASEPIIPAQAPRQQGLAEPYELLHAYLCGSKPKPIVGRVPIGADLRFRNAQQDVALAAQGPAELRESLKAALGGCDAQPPADPESYLHVRDIFFAAPKNAAAKKVQASGSPR